MSSIIRPADAVTIEEAVARLKRGEVVGVPTETVYGIAADASNTQALRALKNMKGRDANKPLQVMVPTREWLKEIAVVNPVAEKISAAFMPGAVTLVLHAKPSAFVHEEIAPGQKTIGVRIPDHPVMLALLKQFGKPLAASSANKAGEPSPVSAAEAEAALKGAITLMIDGGKSAIGKGSTVVDAKDGELKILREGSITLKELERVI